MFLTRGHDSRQIIRYCLLAAAYLTLSTYNARISKPKQHNSVIYIRLTVTNYFI
jgi:hypothetical protein